MKYFLVFLSGVAGVALTDAETTSHEQFIDSLIARNAILLGGGLRPAVDGFSAAYVLVAQDIGTATALAGEDPLVERGLATCAVAEWRLVGINTAAIDPRRTLSA